MRRLFSAAAKEAAHFFKKRESLLDMCQKPEAEVMKNESFLGVDGAPLAKRSLDLVLGLVSIAPHVDFFCRDGGLLETLFRSHVCLGSEDSQKVLHQ